MTDGLAFLPLNEVHQGVLAMRVEMNNSNPVLLQLRAYFIEYYVGSWAPNAINGAMVFNPPHFPMEMWNMWEVVLQIIPEVSGYERLGHLGWVEAVHWFYQGRNLPTISHPLSQHCLEGILHIVNVEFIKFMFLCNRLEDTIETPGVLGGDLAKGRVAGHPASTGADL